MHTNLGAQLSFSLSLLIHPFSPPLVSTSLFICLPSLCLSLALFLSFLPACLRCCCSVFLKRTPHFSLCLFFSVSHLVSIIIFLHLVPSDAISPSHILFASPSPSSLHPHLFLFPACFISPPSPRCPVAASVGGMLKRAATLSWMKSNMTGAMTVAERQMYFKSLHPEMTQSHFL